MSRGPNPFKLVEWTERLERFDSREQTVAQFCAEEGVSLPFNRRRHGSRNSQP